MKQLPPVPVVRAQSPTHIQEKKRKKFFQEEMHGMIDPDDMLHAEVWKCRRDPMKGLRYADLFASTDSFHTPTKSARLLPATPGTPPKMTSSRSRLSPIRRLELQ